MELNNAKSFQPKPQQDYRLVDDLYMINHLNKVQMQSTRL